MKKVMLVMLVVMFAAAFAVGQTYTKGTGLEGYDVLGAHNNGGRGCAGCHAPHSGAAGGGGNAATGAAAFNDPSSGSNALFGQDVTPLFGQTFSFSGYAESLPSQSAAYTTNTDELRDIMMCLACHDGSIAKGQMMTGKSWEQSNGILPAGLYGTRPIPTLLGNDSGDGNTSGYANDHPIGQAATLGALKLVSANGGKASDPLLVVVTCGGISAIVAQSAEYVAFAANYGFPAIAGSAWEYGVVLPPGSADASTAYLTCTTCHNQHVMYIYQAPAGKQTGSHIAGGTYPTYFFINGPYNPGAGNNNPKLAASTTQFCRQCHIGESNEALGVNNVATSF